MPLFQSESKCETILMKMILICMKMKLHAEIIFIWKVSHLDSFWNRGPRELGNGLCARSHWSISCGLLRKNHSSSELLYKSNRPQVSMGYITIIPWARVGYEEIITSYLTRTNGIIVLVNSQTGFCRRFYFHNFTKRPERELGALFSIWRKTPTIGS